MSQTSRRLSKRTSVNGTKKTLHLPRHSREVFLGTKVLDELRILARLATTRR